MNIDLNKRYRTRSGLEVELHEIVPFGSCGNKLTFPVKGSILVTTRKDDKFRIRPRRVYSIWKMGGQYRAVGEDGWDLIPEGKDEH